MLSQWCWPCSQLSHRISWDGDLAGYIKSLFWAQQSRRIRPLTWLMVPGVWLVGFVLAEGGVLAQATTAYTWEVRLERTELASDRQAAIERVQQKAAEQIATWLRQSWPDPPWTPTPQFLRDRRIIYDVYAESLVLELPEGQQIMFAGVALCQLTPENWRELLERTRQAESQQRQWLLAAYGLAPAMVLLFAVRLLYWRKPSFVPA